MTKLNIALTLLVGSLLATALLLGRSLAIDILLLGGTLLGSFLGSALAGFAILVLSSRSLLRTAGLLGRSGGGGAVVVRW